MLSAKGLFVTGTDTEVGKTYVTVLLLRALAEALGPAAKVTGFKAFATGDRHDAERIQAVSRPAPDLDLINPCWFAQPTAPLVSFRQQAEAFPLQMEGVWSAWETLRGSYDAVVAEGVGGWLAPLLPEMRVADFAKALDLPVVVVAANRIGALNHTLLTVERVLADGLPCVGVILNSLAATVPDAAQASNADMLRELLPPGSPLLCELPRGATELPREVIDFLLRSSG